MLLVVEVATGRIWRLPGFWPEFAWSPRSDALLYTVRSKTEASYLFAPALDRLERLPDSLTGISFSPDGRYLGLQVERHGESRAGFLNLETQMAQLLPEGSGGLTWSPKGEEIAYGVGPSCRIHVAKSDGSDPRELLGGGGACRGIYWSPAGTHLLLEAGSNVPQLVSLKDDKRVSLALGQGETAAFLGWGIGGSAVVLELGDGATQAVGLFDMATQTLDRVSLGDDEYALRISPDGTRLLSTELHCSAEPNQTHVRNLQTGQDRTFVLPAAEGWYWSPGGMDFAVSGGGQVLVIDAESGAARTVIPKEGSGFYLHMHRNPWSPDGRFLAVWSGGGHGGGCE